MRTGPLRSTRSQQAAVSGSASSSEKWRTDIGRVTERLRSSPISISTASFPITLEDGAESITATGRTDDGSDESIASPKLAECAVLDGIVKRSKIEEVTLQVALKEGDSAQLFTFSRSWTPPRTILRLAAGPLALVNVTYLVADDDLAVEDLLIGLPVLQHLGIDTKSLLESKRDVLDGIDCSSVRSSTGTTCGGHVSRLISSRLNRVVDPFDFNTPPDPSRPRVNFYSVQEEVDPFPDKSLLHPIDSAQQEEVSEAIENMVQVATDSGFPNDNLPELKEIVTDHTDIFRTSFSSGPPANIEPLKIDLVPDAKPVRVRLRNYSQDQREFFSATVSKLVDCGMAYPNPTSPWASVPLLVAKPGPAKSWFTVYLRPVNRLTVKN